MSGKVAFLTVLEFNEVVALAKEGIKFDRFIFHDNSFNLFEEVSVQFVHQCKKMKVKSSMPALGAFLHLSHTSSPLSQGQCNSSNNCSDWCSQILSSAICLVTFL